jgi:transposase InsO family protein
MKKTLHPLTLVARQSRGKPRRGRPPKERTQSKAPQPELRGRRFTPEQQARALSLVAAGIERVEVARIVGTTVESVRRWVDRAREDGTMPSTDGAASSKQSKVNVEDKVTAVAPVLTKREAARSPYAPRDPGQGLSEHEVAAILELKRMHPSMGPAQLRAQLKRFKGWRLSLKAIARVLRGHGYEPVHRSSRPVGPEPIRFEAPRRNALWQLDFCEVRVGDERLYVLIILDDFSRFVTGHALSDSPSSEIATQTLKAAIARHGKPEAVRTDRGGAFVAFTRETDFGRFLERELIDHIVGRSYQPKGGGKVEAAVGTLRRELWDVCHFQDRAEAEARLVSFFADYNERRAHMGIDGLTPADRFFGRADRVLAEIDAISRKRQGVLSMNAPLGAPIEESKAPLEVLRLIIKDGQLEMRFCGARVRLGRIEP